MVDIITRSIGENAKGSALTKEELDTNFLNLVDAINTPVAPSYNVASAVIIEYNATSQSLDFNFV